MLHKIRIKPLSTNHAYRGRRFKTPELKKYIEDLSMLLPKITIPKGLLQVQYRFGFSSKGSDIDNVIKQFQDILATCYEFNDNRIYRAIVEKEIVKKGEEFVAFKVSRFLTSPKSP